MNANQNEMRNSYFDGSAIQLVGWNILCGIVTVITLGLGAFWARVTKIRWETRHTVIDGKRLYFNGTAFQLFGKLVGWEILEIFILGIIMIICIVIENDSYYDTGMIWLGIVLDALILIFSLPAFEVYMKKWQVKHTTVIDDNGRAYEYNSDGTIYYPTVYESQNVYSAQNQTGSQGKICANCGQLNTSDSIYCANCGKELEKFQN